MNDTGIIYKTPCTEKKREIGDIITFPSFIREAEEFRNLLLRQKFFHFDNHPRGGVWNGMRTDSIISILNYDHFQELANTFLAATDNLELSSYQIEIYGEFHSTEEKDPDYIKQIAPNFDYAGIVFLTPTAPSSAGIEFMAPIEDFDPYELNDESNFNTRDVVPNTFNTLVTFNPKEYVRFPEFFGDTVESGGLFLIMLLIILVVWLSIIELKVRKLKKKYFGIVLKLLKISF